MNQSIHSKKIVAMLCSVVMVMTSACSTTQALSGTRASMSNDIKAGKNITVFYQDGRSQEYKVKQTTPDALLVDGSGGVVETIPWTAIAHVEFSKADPEATRNGLLIGALIVVGVAALAASGSSEAYSYSCTGWWCP